MPVGHVTGEIALVLGAVVVLLFASFAPRRHQANAAIIALAACVTSAALIARTMLTEHQILTFAGTWSLDDIAGWAELVILGSTILTIALSPEWMRSDPRHGEWYALLLFSATGAMVLASAATTLELMMGVLLSSATGYVLAAYHRRSALSVEAGAKYFLIGALTNTTLLIGITILFGIAGTTGYIHADQALSNDGTRLALVAAVVLVTIGLAFKIGATPAHTWVPDVAQGAPAPAAAFLTVVPKIGGIIALARFVAALPDDTVAWRPLIALLAVATMTVGNLAALWQHDVRRLLGWSSISQAGYALMAVVVIERSEHALVALIYFVTAYALAQFAAFGVVTELRGRTAIADYRGLLGQRPWLAACLAVALLSFIGVPPLAGFAGKLLLFTAAIDGGYAWLAIVAIANTVVSLFYYLRIIAPMTFERSPTLVPLLGRWAATATTIATVLIIALGVGAEAMVHALDTATLLP